MRLLVQKEKEKTVEEQYSAARTYLQKKLALHLNPGGFYWVKS